MVSSAPPTPSPAGPPDSRRTQGTLTQQESGASPGGGGVREGRQAAGPGSGQRFREALLSEGSRPWRTTSGGRGKAGVVPVLAWGPGGHRQVLGLTSAFLG